MCSKRAEKIGQKEFVLCRNSLLRMLANKTGHLVSWSVLRDMERWIIYVAVPTRRGTFQKKRVKHEPPYRHAAGWVLLSGLSAKLQHKYYQKWSLPGPYWPEICDEVDFCEVLSTIRKDEGLIKTVDDRVELAVPVFRKNHMIAAISLSMPTSKVTHSLRENVFRMLLATAKTMEKSEEDSC
jgi:DNA-binding IclR family transcriptional regulator